MTFTKRCSKCNRTIEYNKKYCDICAVDMDKKKKEDTRLYDKNIRDKDSKAFYHSKSWLVVRQEVINFFNGLCIYSLLVDNKIVKADLVHHIESLKENKSKTLDKSNLIPVSSSIHNYIENEYDKSDADKKAMQDKLYELLEEYKKRYKK